MDLCIGPLFKQTVIYTVPLALSALLQFLFNAADMIVIGRYASAVSMGAVGATSSMCKLIITVFIGISIGANVVVANSFGAKDKKNVSRATHTAIALSIVGGILLMLVGLVVSKPLLKLMDVPPDVLDKSCIYMWIYCCGIPANLMFNFGSAILRAIGDTKSPLRYLTVAGCLNVLLNLLFVIVFHMDVAGVAIATVASHVLSAVLIMRNLADSRTACRVRWKLVRIHVPIMKNIIRIGLPAGLQSSLYCIANMTIQAGVNSFGAMTIAGNTAAGNIEGFIHIASVAYYQAVTTFVGQNFGGGQYKRIVKSIFYCGGSAVAVDLLFATIVLFVAPQLIAFYNSDPEVVAVGVSRLKVLAIPYAIGAIMDVITGSLRGLGHSVRPAVVTLIGACLLRIFWVMFVFPMHRTLPFLLLCFPISWVVVSLINGEHLWRLLRSLKKQWAS